MRASEELLADFARTGSERSFSELVARHVDLVYATALRTANGDKHLAQDISQMVFADLVRKAGELEPGTIVPGWLYRHTRFTAAKVIRGEKRRQIREVQAVQQIDMCSEAEEDCLNGALDDALESLNEEERQAVILRFFQKRDFRAIGRTFGLSEDAAQKRVSRALDKLRAILEERGITVTTTAVGLALMQGATAAPAHIGTKILTKLSRPIETGAANAVPLTILNSKMKTVIAFLAIIGVATPLVWQSRSLAEAREEKVRMQQQLAEMTEVKRAAQKNIEESREQLRRAQQENQELYRLRGEVAILRRLRRREPSVPVGLSRGLRKAFAMRTRSK